jgi:hypothetical protein
MFTNILKARLTALRDTMRERRRRYDRNREHIRALAVESGISILTVVIDTYLTEPSINTIITWRIELLVRSRDKHMETCAVPDDCTVTVDYDARIEELEWLLEVLNGSTAEIPVPNACDQPDCPTHL